MEVWKYVPGYDGRYLVSNIGRVQSRARGVARVLRPSTDGSGYKQVVLCLDKSRKTVKVHRLVAEAFCDGYHPGREVNHRNGVKADNRASNLEWCTRSENMMHAWRTGLHKKTDTLILSAANARMCKAAKDAQKVLDSEKSQASNR